MSRWKGSWRYKAEQAGHKKAIIHYQFDLCLKVRYTSDDQDFYGNRVYPPEPEDFKVFQERVRLASITFTLFLSSQPNT